LSHTGKENPFRVPTKNWAIREIGLPLSLGVTVWPRTSVVGEYTANAARRLARLMLEYSNLYTTFPHDADRRPGSLKKPDRSEFSGRLLYGRIFR